MNIDRGFKRLLSALSVPLCLIGVCLVVFGYWKVLYINHFIKQTEISASEFSSDQEIDPNSKLSESEEKEFLQLHKRRVELRRQKGALLKQQIPKYIGYTEIGFLFIGGAFLLWGLFFTFRWVVRGFTS